MLANLRNAVRDIPGARAAALRMRFGNLRRTEPLSAWGSQRGKPVDRWYIERYLADHAELVCGDALEVKDDMYATRYGATTVDVVDIDPGNTAATVVGDLCRPGTLQRGRYDVAIVTQTLQLMADPAEAVRNLLAGLRPGGCLLLTVPTLSRLVDDSDLWRWTPAGLRRLLAASAPAGADVEVTGLGNGLAARAFLFGLATQDLDEVVLAKPDPHYPLLVGARVRLPG